MNDEQLLRYARHILLDELGIEGQERLLAARVLIVGAGGLARPPRCTWPPPVGDITLADDDVVELSNPQRQILHTTASVGRPKAESGRDMLAAFNPQARVHARVERLQGQAPSDAVAAADLVLDCTDNFTTRHAINRACVEHRKPLVSGAAIRFDGQVSVYDLRDDKAPCYHCLFPEADDVEQANCATMGVFAPVVGIIGSIQAAEALKLLSGVGESLSGRLQWLDAPCSGAASMCSATRNVRFADTGPPENSRRALSASAGFTGVLLALRPMYGLKNPCYNRSLPVDPGRGARVVDTGLKFSLPGGA